MTERQRSIILAVASAVIACALLFAWSRYQPAFVEGSYRERGSETWTSFTYPLWLWDTGVQGVDFRISMTMGAIHPSHIRLRMRGIPRDLRWNGMPVEPSPLERVLDLSGLARGGRNEFEGTLDSDASVPLLLAGLSTALVDDVERYLALAIILFVSGALIMGLMAFWRNPPGWLSPVIMLAVFLRILYTFATPYWKHAYDWRGHHEYIMYVLNNWTIPHAQSGWEAFQAPLYYFLAAGWLACAKIVGIGYGAVQALSVVISLATFFAGVWITFLLFPKPKDRLAAFGCCLLFAVFPALTYSASQASNDTLLYLLCFLTIGFLLRWFLHGTHRDWLLASLALALALLTKTNAVLLLPAMAAAVLLRRMPLMRKGRLFLECLGIIAVICGWFLVLRFVVEGERSLVGNIHDLATSSNLMPNTFAAFTTFQPFAMLLHPFSGATGDPREPFALEYLFRSSLFNHHVSPLFLGRIFLLSALAMIPLPIIGLFYERKKPHTWVLLVLATSLLSGVLVYRYIYPFSADQHFRFIVPVLIPLILWTGGALRESRRHNLLMLSLICAFATISSVFLLALSMTGG